MEVWWATWCHHFSPPSRFILVPASWTTMKSEASLPFLLSPALQNKIAQPLSIRHPKVLQSLKQGSPLIGAITAFLFTLHCLSSEGAFVWENSFFWLLHLGGPHPQFSQVSPAIPRDVLPMPSLNVLNSIGSCLQATSPKDSSVESGKQSPKI